MIPERMKPYVAKLVSFAKMLGEFLLLGFLLVLIFSVVTTVLIEFYAPVEGYSDFLIATSVLISLSALAVTAIFNYKSLSLIRDEYQPVPSITFENLPPQGYPETAIIVANVGKRNLFLSSIKITGDWFKGEKEVDPDEDAIAPGETITLLTELDSPIPDGYRKLTVLISDNENEMVWNKRHVFKVTAEFDVSVHPSNPS